ncbi:MAG: methyltransferase domain-containing protein [Thermomicrobium sp.]|nr:methyltransferase domain-containing protein [Thermomicrobium sp.]
MTQGIRRSQCTSGRSQPEDLSLPGWDRARLGPLRTRRVVLPRSGASFRIVQPADIDRLLDLAAADPEEQLPYWAELWPSGIALADAVLLEPDTLRGQRVIELGCGLGVTAAAALRAGAELLAMDYSAEALVLTCWNCAWNAGLEPAVLRVNWRQPPEEVFAAAGFASVPVILAADVLYERRDVEPLRSLVERLLRPGGLLWLAEPGRATAASFVESLRDAGWQDETDMWPGPWPDANDATVAVTVHRLRRPGSAPGAS